MRSIGGHDRVNLIVAAIRVMMEEHDLPHSSLFTHSDGVRIGRVALHGFLALAVEGIVDQQIDTLCQIES